MKQNDTERNKDIQEQQQLDSRLANIRNTFVVLSGKGGVGKSTIAVNFAMALTESGYRVGLLDVDFHGPSIPTMLGLEQETIQQDDDGLIPVEIGSLKVMSVGFFLQNKDDAVIWRGPMKMGVIKQLLKDVVWGDLDYLIIDSPPGTGDEPLSICQLIKELTGAIIVTTPQKVSAVDVRKSVTFCRRLNIPVLGIVENMDGFTCPHCGNATHILPEGGGRNIATDMQIPFLGSIPFEPQIAQSGDEGRVFMRQYAGTQSADAMLSVINALINSDGKCSAQPTPSDTSAELISKTGPIRLAIPIDNGKLSMHFGHCSQFSLLDINESERTILNRTDINAPPHEPGLLPRFLAEQGVHMIIAGGMGQRAQQLFTDQGIHVLVGAPSETPETLVNRYLSGALQQGVNICDH
jgi:ATP-binding protein involved in chromosome partitioning